MTTLPGEGSLLRIFIGESDRHAGMLLYEWIVRTAREHGLAGATVLRGVEGFGARSRVRTAKILELSTDLPIIVEIVDRAEKIEAFLPVIDGAIADGLATVERVQIKFYRSGRAETPYRSPNIKLSRAVVVSNRV
jgi:PII-like signaling protein